MHSALDNLRVLDFTRVLAGPLATMLLGDLGAEVTKIERPGVGDDTRDWGPPYGPSGQASYFEAVNRNKSSRIIDLGTDEGCTEALELAGRADVVVENFRPGVMDRLGLGYEQLSQVNPGLVYCSITGFGRGAGADMPGYDLAIQALGGLMSITGDPAGEPQKVGVALVDVITGLYASVGVLAALRHRDRTGAGQRVDVNLLSCLLAALANQASGYTSAGVVPTRLGNRHPSIAPYELFPTQDRDLVLAVGNDRQFAEMCGALGMDDLVSDARFATNPARVAHREILREMLLPRLKARPALEWVTLLSAARVPAGVVNDVSEAFALATDLGLDPIVEMSRADGAAVRLPRNPIDLSGTPVQYRTPPPDLPSVGQAVEGSPPPTTRSAAVRG